MNTGLIGLDRWQLLMVIMGERRWEKEASEDYWNTLHVYIHTHYSGILSASITSCSPIAHHCRHTVDTHTMLFSCCCCCCLSVVCFMLLCVYLLFWVSIFVSLLGFWAIEHCHILECNQVTKQQFDLWTYLVCIQSQNVSLSLFICGPNAS